jgi:hypothetical protein
VAFPARGGKLSGVITLTLMTWVLAAAPKKAPPPKPPPPPVVKKEPAAPPTLDRSASAAALVTQLDALYTALEYDKVVPLAEQVLARDDLTLDQRLEVYRLQGCAKAIVDDPVDAEKPFRLLLRARADYELPASTPPKILAVFRKVQSEERALAGLTREVERARIIAGLKLLGDPPTKAQGGLPLKFQFRLRDPTSAVESMRVSYRRDGQNVFSSLALQRSEEGDWRGALAGEVTADPKGFVMQYFVETVDATGPLLTLGAAATPRSIQVAAGQVPVARFKPIPPALWATSAAVTGVLGAGWGALGISQLMTQSAYTRYVNSAGPISGAVVNQRIAQGQQLTTFTNAAWISAVSMLVVTLVMVPFTDFLTE